MKPPLDKPLVDTDLTWGEAMPAPNDPPVAERRNGTPRPSSRFDGTNPVPPSERIEPVEDDPFELTPIGALLDEADESITFIIDGLIPKASVNVLAAKPKVGKSTLARALALAVARGEEVLGRRCPEPGTVWYLAFEGSRADIKKAFRQLGATADDLLHLFIGKAPSQVIAKVRARAVSEHPDLIIIDTMQRFLRAKSTDDYAEMTLLFDHVIGIAQQSQAALLLLTHNSKIEREGIDAILGSTAIAGSVDTAILLNRTPRYRTIATVQRTGEDLGETILVLDKGTGAVALAGSRKLADHDALCRELYAALEKAAAPLKQADLLERVEARRLLKLAALRDLCTGNYGNRNVIRNGAGTKGDPFFYDLEARDSSSLVPLRVGTSISPSLFSSTAPSETSQKASSRMCTGSEPASNGPSAGNRNPAQALDGTEDDDELF